MMMYVLICLSLSLAGVAGLQFFYLAYLERVELEHKKRIRELEHQCRNLVHKLGEAELQINEQAQLIESVYGKSTDKEEVWVDVIEDA